MKKFYLILSLFLFNTFVFSKSKPESFLLINDYYAFGRVEKEIVKNNTKTALLHFENNQNSENFAILLENLNVYTVYALLEDDLKGDLKNYDTIVEKNIKKYFYDGKLLDSYLDFKWNEMSVGGSFSIINTFPFYCRMLAKNADYKSKALFRLALWYIYATNETMARWNVFIKNQEYFIEELNSFEKYNAYLHYAIFYMKIGCRRYAFALVKKAEEIYPENVMHYILSENFKKGEFGW